MNVITNLILIQIIVVIIIDISGVVEHVEGLIARMLSLKKVSIHLIECSFCVSHWIGLFYLLVTGSLSLKSYCFVLILSFFTTVTKELMYCVRDNIIKVINKLY